MPAGVTDRFGPLSATWQLVATGAGYCSVEAIENPARWATTMSGSAPAAGVDGHTIEQGTSIHMELVADQRLWVRGKGHIVRTAANPA